MSIKIAVGGGMWDVGGQPVTRHDSEMNRWVWSVESRVEEVLPSIGGQNQKRLRPLLFSAARLIKTRFADSDKSCAWSSESAKCVLWLVNLWFPKTCHMDSGSVDNVDRKMDPAVFGS